MNHESPHKLGLNQLFHSLSPKRTYKNLTLAQREHYYSFWSKSDDFFGVSTPKPTSQTMGHMKIQKRHFREMG